MRRNVRKKLLAFAISLVLVGVVVDDCLCLAQLEHDQKDGGHKLSNICPLYRYPTRRGSTDRSSV
jgi:hypothetical protein